MTAALVFWLAAALLAWVWVGYPLLLRLLRGWRAPEPETWGETVPRLSVIVAAYNEAGCIRAKLDGTLAQRYPAQRLEVLVVSDGSTDGTDAIVRAHPDRRVRLLRQDPRAGKSAALNRGVAAARGDVLVFTDANALFGPDALAALAAPFADPEVGVVSGQGLYGSLDDVDARVVAGAYARYEAAIKVGESALGFLASTDGAIYGMRRSLYVELEPNEVNDLLHPIQAILAGAQSRFAPNAYTVEPPSSGGRQEFRRHVRIVAQGMHLLRRWLPALLARRQWRAIWMLLSHRLLRWATAPALLTLLIANVLLLERGGVYTVTLAGQAAFYALVLAGGLADRAGRGLGSLAVPYYFCVVAAAQMGGLVRFLRGGAQAVWNPTGGTVRERAA
jgi:cellulose synthase/poly-beta-1,6-N-acetylglucosamine synthase-like glycosyltransferase